MLEHGHNTPAYKKQVVASDTECNVYRVSKRVFLAFMVVNTINHSHFNKNRFLSFLKSVHLH